jgi:transcription antitermination factor NusG
MAMLAVDHERLLALAADEAQKLGVIEATIVPETDPLWHIVETYPTHEFVAAAHLAARRFGVFLPSLTVKFKDRFRRILSRDKTLFPGYVFVFVWDLMEHRRRILACPGVKAIVYAAGVAAVAPDTMIDHLRIREAYAQDVLEVAGKRRRRRKTRDNVGEQDSGPVGVRISPYDALRGIDALDGEARNMALKKALGLAS